MYYFQRISKRIFWNVFFEGEIFKKKIWDIFFEGAILREIFENIYKILWEILNLADWDEWFKLFTASKKIHDFDTYKYQSKIID